MLISRCETRHFRLCDPFTSSTLDSLPCPVPFVPYTYPITCCLSPATTSSTVHLCCRPFWSLAACFCAHAGWLCASSSSSSPLPRTHTCTPQGFSLNRWSCVVFAVIITWSDVSCDLPTFVFQYCRHAARDYDTCYWLNHYSVVLILQQQFPSHVVSGAQL